MTRGGQPTTHRRGWIGAAAVAALCLLVVGCSLAPTGGPDGASSSVAPIGGTLRVGIVGLTDAVGFTVDESSGSDGWMDPQSAFPGGDTVYGSFLRCCVLRTLMLSSGEPIGEGGGELVPDLAAAPPEISADGRTWTFRIQPGLRYAPPLEEVEITAPDFVRALERTLRPRPTGPSEPHSDPIGGYIASFYSVIEGAQEFLAREADTISGIRVPDRYTIEFTLSDPTGDFGERLAFPAMAPIPPGASDGHDSGYGRYLVASGPYMIEGSEQLDFTLPPQDQPVLGGLGADGAMTLVRNPSWQRSSDRLRPAIVDRIEVVDHPDPAGGAPGSDPGEAIRSAQSDVIAGLTSDADVLELEQQPGLSVLYVDRPATTFVPLNLGRPPFDDIHVRRAVNLAVDRAAVIGAKGPGYRLARHHSPDVLTHGLLTGFDPYRTANAAGDLGRARSEMQQSRYDHDRDGTCDDAACRGVSAVVVLNWDWAQDVATLVRDDLREIGIEVDLILADPDSEPDPIEQYVLEPTTRLALIFGMGWASDYPSAGAWMSPQSRSAEHGNFTLVGASDEELEAWGYETRGLPNVDDRIDRCTPLAGSAGARCWAELEQYLHEEVVPWIPLAQQVKPTIIGQGVTSFAIDLVTTDPAYERIAVSGG
jgi:peptide/nickel transport system substrate-binding protein